MTTLKSTINLKTTFCYRFIANRKFVLNIFVGICGLVEIAGYTTDSEISLENPIITHTSSKLINTFLILVLYHGHVRPRQWFMSTK